MAYGLEELQEWLHDRGAAYQGSTKLANSTRKLYHLNGRYIAVRIDNNTGGWEVYLSAPSIGVADTLDWLDEQIGGTNGH